MKRPSTYLNPTKQGSVTSVVGADFPGGNLWDRVSDIHHRFTATEPERQRGLIEVATSQMSEVEAVEVQLIVDFTARSWPTTYMQTNHSCHSTYRMMGYYLRV